MARKKERDPFFELFAQFFETHLPVTMNRSGCTVESYRAAFRLLEAYYVESTGKPFATMTMGALDAAFVESFAAWLKESRGNCQATVNARVAAVKSFMSFCASRDAVHVARCESVRAVKMPRIPDRGIDYLTIEEVGRVLAQPDTSTPKGLRDCAFMSLMYETGARMKEMLGLRLGDIAVDAGIPCVWLTGKGRKRRVVPVSPEMTALLAAYMEVYHTEAGAKASDLLFYTVIHGMRCQMSPDCADKFIKKHAAAAHKGHPGIPPKMKSHLWRHSRAMHLYQAGNDLITVRDFLGHTSIAVTDVYARADAHMLSEAAAKVELKGGAGEPKRWKDGKVATQLQAYLKLHGLA